MGRKTASRTTRAHSRRSRRPRAGSRAIRPGTPAGSLDAVAVEDLDPEPSAALRLIRYGRSGPIEERDDITVDDCRMPGRDADEVTWLHLQGSPDSAQLQALGRIFGLHPLALEDVLHRESRAKVESYDGQQFIVLDQAYRGEDGSFASDPVCFFLGRSYLISIVQGSHDIFEPVRQRIRTMGKVRAHGADFLLYALVDLIVDAGFPLLESLGDRLEALEDEILEGAGADARNRIHFIKRELVAMRRAWWPQREVIATLLRDGERLLSETTRLYLRDCHDHSVIMIDFVETYREMAASLLDTWLSAVSQRMNDIMKTLTIIATIFLPLTFITGLYGMNFDPDSPWNMPELRWHFGYFYALGIMSAIAVGMIAWFRRRHWL